MYIQQICTFVVAIIIIVLDTKYLKSFPHFLTSSSSKGTKYFEFNVLNIRLDYNYIILRQLSITTCTLESPIFPPYKGHNRNNLFIKDTS